MNTTTITLTKDTIDELVNEETTIVAGLLNLYRHALPDWDKITSIPAYAVQVNRTTAEYIIDRFTVNPNNKKTEITMTWLNSGFGCSRPNVPEWEVFVDNTDIERM